MMNEGDDEEIDQILKFDTISRDEQFKLFKQISRDICKSSRKFDID